MGYQSRKRKYVSRRERIEKHTRNFRIIALFVVIGSVVLLIRNGTDIYYYLKTFFY